MTIFPPVTPNNPFIEGSPSDSLADGLLQGKTLKKSVSLTKCLTFDLFERVPPSSGRVDGKVSDDHDDLKNGLNSSVLGPRPGPLPSFRNKTLFQNALLCVQETNRFLPQANFRYGLSQGETTDSAFCQLHEKRTMALKWLAAAENIDLSRNNRATHLSEICMENLLEQQFFEPAENVIPIFGFYLRTHPEVSPSELAENLHYVENCYEAGLGKDAEAQRLRQRIYAGDEALEEGEPPA